MDKMLKNSGENIFGGRQGPPKPPFRAKTAVLGPLSPPENIFFTIFQHLIHLCGLSAFQHAFTQYFTLTLGHFMMVFHKIGIFG